MQYFKVIFTYLSVIVQKVQNFINNLSNKLPFLAVFVYSNIQHLCVRAHGRHVVLVKAVSDNHKKCRLLVFATANKSPANLVNLIPNSFS